MTFEEFYQNNKTLVYRLCRAKANRELAEDSTARAFVEIWKRWEKVSQMTSPVAYTVTIAQNIIYKEYIKSKARIFFRLDTIEDLADNFDSPEEQTFKNEKTQLFWDSLRRLSDREQEILILKDLENRSLQECSDILSLSIPAIKSLRYRAKEKLASILKERLGESYE